MNGSHAVLIPQATIRPMRVLVVEDEKKLADLLARGLREEGHAADVAGRGEEALWMARAVPYDAIVLDVMLPGLDGFATCRALREADVWSPVLMLTARDAVENRIEGLDSGADDYLVKPFSFAELAARLRALDRRPKPGATELRSDALALDLIRRTATARGERLDLTPTEFSLRAALLRERGAPISRRALLSEVWGYEFDPGTNVVDVHVNRLRRKLEDRGLSDVIRTVRGSGYAAG